MVRKKRREMVREGNGMVRGLAKRGGDGNEDIGRQGKGEEEGVSEGEVDVLHSCTPPQLIDAAIALTKKVYGGDEMATHRCDFDWLLDSVIKARYTLLV